VRVIQDAGSFTSPDEGAGNHWIEQLRAPDLSVGTYSIPRGGADDQVPHTEEVIYVPAGEVHRFTGITADLAALVLFAPAEGARASAG
jgi:hypothetical protein